MSIKNHTRHYGRHYFKSIKSLLLILFFVLGVFFDFPICFATGTVVQNKKQIITPPQEGKRKPASIASPPPFKKGEYAVFHDGSYSIFKTLKYNGVEYSTNCRKNKKITCTAADAVKYVKLNQQIRLPYYTNLGAVYCSAIGGKNLIALDHLRNERDFCKFSDGSMASSWSLYWQYEQRASSN